MKKLTHSAVISMVLVMLLVIVGLSTATFAWFSASNTVNITDISFTADAVKDENTDLAIGWTEEPTTYSIAFEKPPKIKPMIPKEKFVVGKTRFFKELDLSTFQTSIEEPSKDKGPIYRTNGMPCSAYVCKHESGMGTFHVYNKNKTLGQLVSVYFDIHGDVKNSLVVALFKNDVFAGYLSNLKKIAYGPIVKGTAVADTPTTEEGVFSSGSLKFELAPNEDATINLVVWFDGIGVKNADLYRSAVLSNFAFSGEYITK